MDYGERQTLKITKEVEKRINKEYAQAEKEIQEKLEHHLKQYEKKDKEWQKLVKDGKKTQADYVAWRKSQMLISTRWKKMREEIANDLLRVHKDVLKEVKSSLPEVYAANFNFGTYEAEHGAGVNTSFTLYNREAVEDIVLNNRQMLPPLQDRGKEAAARKDRKAFKYYNQQLQSVMMQGILQGESIPKIAKRIATQTGEKERKAAIRNARTAATGAHNSGRLNAYQRAEKKGVEMHKMWLATMDNRTRHSHRWLDEETRPVDEAFSNGLQYPGDTKGDPSEVYNCRCSMRAVVKGLERRAMQYKDNRVGDMSYEEWRNSKPKYKSSKKKGG